MSRSTWKVAEPREFTFDDPVGALSVRIVGGAVNVVGTDPAALAARGGTRLEITSVEGPPLLVTREGDTLTVGYEDLTWQGLLDFFDRRGRRRSAVVSLAVPASASVEVGCVDAAAMVSGVRGRTEIRGVNGDTTLVGLSGRVLAETVSGSVEAQAVTGALKFHSVSGDLTVVEGTGSSVRADSVSGNMVLDLDPAGDPTDIHLGTVSGEVAIRLPHPVDTEVVANTASGSVHSAFEDLRVTGKWGAKKITGTLGSGNGTLRAATVSGSIALLRRPPSEDTADAADTADAPDTTDTTDTAGAQRAADTAGPSDTTGPSGAAGGPGGPPSPGAASGDGPDAASADSKEL
ncbi:DUF4097 family beta strand repeat-containing protein [Streptomyces fuscigenes]|uniref:DUF4097 family beta strand repeat-containing protein n=1 Tax=Streptomyces fuscigenes TaxID=1528880 RepID=UPI001F2964D6|nr:DUF4097 family beta strand repeat-containing protein [Streptomyces fuscigenes]MCF3963903.1 DUF4097 family beta strand repeat-containing protein [Streptomyces fuscigenes]